MPTLVEALPAQMMVEDDFLTSIKPSDLVYFLLNVGDGDTQLMLLPADARTGRRQAVVVDVAGAKKLERLLETLETTSLLGRDAADTDELFTVVVGTHPHADHIAGMPAFLRRFGGLVREYWDSGYYHTSAAYQNTMAALEDGGIDVVQPTSGATRFVGQVKLTVLTPGIELRNKYDTYGIEINNSSISLKLEFPASRVVQRDQGRELVRGRVQSLILGADAQTLSWAHAMSDFPQLHPSESPVAKIMDRAQGHHPLKADVFKVPHHGSKHGLNLELVEKMGPPRISLISSVAGAGKYNFPHLLSLESLREARNPIASKVGGSHNAEHDHDHGIHVTGASDDGGNVLGSIALVMSSTTNKRTLWRFYDGPAERVDLQKGKRLAPTP